MMLLLIVMLIIEGTWSVHLYHSWPFVIIVTIAAVLMAVAGVFEMRAQAWIGALSHFGLCFVLLGGMQGAVVRENAKMVVDSHASERVAYGENGESIVLPFAIQLKDFRIDYYDDGKKPKQYTSTLEISPCSNSDSGLTSGSIAVSTSVNHPAKVDGWWIYQFDYDRSQQDFVVLQVVRDPLLPMVYVGFVLMVIGALLQVIRAWHSWKVIPAALVVTAIFTAASLARIELGTLVPALRSLWFFPHVLIYMVAYSLLAIALVLSIISLCSNSDSGLCSNSAAVASKLFTTVSAFLLIGMLCGAFWAKDAWGDYWTWDPKECWAAVTWLITVVSNHIPAKKKWHTFIMIVITFAAIQVTWYGVNYLPSAQYSMHTYNR